MKYTVSTKKVLSDIRKADWLRRIEILTLSNQGWDNTAIAKKFGVARQEISREKKLMGEITVEEAEKLAKL